MITFEMSIFILIVILIIFIVYKLFNTREHQTNILGVDEMLLNRIKILMQDDIKREINTIYRGDIDAIRNLGSLAGNILTNDTLNIPAATNIEGDIKVNGNTEIKENLTVAGNTEIKENLTVNGITKFNDLIIDTSIQGKVNPNIAIEQNPNQNITNNININDNIKIDTHMFQLQMPNLEYKTISLGRFFINGIDIRDMLIGAILYNQAVLSDTSKRGINSGDFRSLLLGRYDFTERLGTTSFMDTADVVIVQPGFGVKLHNAALFAITELPVAIILNWGKKPLRIDLFYIDVYEPTKESYSYPANIPVFRDDRGDFIATSFPEYNHDSSTYYIKKNVDPKSTTFTNRIASVQVFKVGEHPAALNL